AQAQRGVAAHGVEEAAADELDPGYERFRRLDVALDQGDAVNRLFELRAAEMLIERRRREKKTDAESLAGAVVLQDQRKPEPLRGLRDVIAADRGDRRRRLDIERGQRLVLRGLRYLQRERAFAIDDGAAVALEPRDPRAPPLRS